MRNVALAIAVVCASAGANAAPRPELYVGIASLTDATAIDDAATAKVDSMVVRRAIGDVLDHAHITTALGDVERFALDKRTLDVSIIALDAEQIEAQGDDDDDDVQPVLRVTAVVRVVMSDEHGTVISVMSGRASAERVATMTPRALYQLRHDALDQAARRALDRLLWKRASPRPVA
jgi:hypothetical protein